MKFLTKEQYELKMKEIQLKNMQIKMRNDLKEEKRKYKQTKKTSTSNKVLIASISAIVLYTIVALVIQYYTSIEVSTTLSTLWYGFWTVEITALAGIKVSKVIKHHENVDSDTEAKG